MTDTTTGPMVVLIGGPMTVDDGSRVDTRQPIVGDAQSRIMRKSLASSWLWWNTVCSLATPILEAAGPESFALLLGERSIVELRADGSIKRTALRGLLPGRSSKVFLVRTGMKDDALPTDYTEVATLRAWNGESLGKIGVKVSDSVGGRWRFLNGNEFYLTQAGPHLAPAVIVDTGDTLMIGADGPIPADCFLALEQRRLFDDEVVLIVPHTYRAEVVLRSYSEWVQSGRPDRSADSAHTLASSWDPAAPPNPIHYALPVPIDAEFRVTGLVQDGKWRSPDDLEAARSLLESRYDLKIGIWDLVRNPLLRRALLESAPAEPVPREASPIPVGAAQRADAAVTAAVGRREEEGAALTAIHLQAEPLRRAGWIDARPDSLRLHLPYVFLTLSITRRSVNVSAFTQMYNRVNLQSYLTARRETLETIAGMELTGLDKLLPVLWRGSGGWSDEVDWRFRFGELATKTAAWIPVFSELIDQCRRIQAEWS